MRTSLVFSLLVHAAVGATAWWLLARPEAKVVDIPTLHIRQTVMLAPEPPPPRVPPPTHPALPDEPIDAVEPEPQDDFELDEQAVIELRPEWVAIRQAPLTRPLRLRPRAKVALPSVATHPAAAVPKPTVRKHTVKGSDVSARPIKGRMPAARYPSRALRLGLTGTVRLRARVGADGRVARVEVLRSSGSKLLDRAAIDALELWHFSPARRNGKPAAQWVRVPFRFQLRSESLSRTRG